MYFNEYTQDIYNRRPILKAIDVHYHGDKDKRIYYVFNRYDYKCLINLVHEFYRDLERLVLLNEYCHKHIDSVVTVRVEKIDCKRLIHRKYHIGINVFDKRDKHNYIAKDIYPFDFMIMYPK